MRRRYGVLIALGLSMALGLALTLRFEYRDVRHQVQVAALPGVGTEVLDYRDSPKLIPIAGSAVGAGIGIFLFSGVLPGLLWAAFKFRRDQVAWVTISWCVLALIISGANYKTRSYEECRQHAAVENCI